MLRGMSGAELESVMLESFIAADTDGGGSLDVKEFKKVCGT